MAELAIPLIALGGLYIASNRNNDNQEGYIQHISSLKMNYQILIHH